MASGTLIAFVAQSRLAMSRTVRRHPRLQRELIWHPFAAHDDFIDAVSRYIDPQSSVPYDAKSTESIEAMTMELTKQPPKATGLINWWRLLISVSACVALR